MKKEPKNLDNKGFSTHLFLFPFDSNIQILNIFVYFNAVKSPLFIYIIAIIYGFRINSIKIVSVTL